MPSRLAIAFAIIAVTLALLWLAQQIGDKPEVLVDAAPLQRSHADTLALIPLPPPLLRGDATATVHFAEPSKVTQLCGGAPEGKLLLGCATSDPPQMAVPNPCLFVDEIYGRLLCHEIGHIHRWSKAHEQA